MLVEREIKCDLVTGCDISADQSTIYFVKMLEQCFSLIIKIIVKIFSVLVVFFIAVK